MYNKLEQTLKSRADGLDLSVLFMWPDGGEKCKGVVQLVHGMSEYKERYLPLMGFLAEHGYASVIHDHRGHGKSIKFIEDLGYMYEVGMEAFIDDVLLVNEYARNQVPNVPLTVFGHSMGSLASRVFLRNHEECMDTLILSGPPSKNSAVDMGIMLVKLQKAFKGSRSPGKLLEMISFGSYCRQFIDENSKYAWICSDKEVVKQYEADPFCGFTFTADGYVVLLNLLKYTYLENGWKCRNQDMPILYLGGIQDPCIGGKDKFEEEMMVLKRVGYNHVSGKLYEDMRHEICNEPGNIRVFQDILMFLEKNKK